MALAVRRPGHAGEVDRVVPVDRGGLAEGREPPPRLPRRGRDEAVAEFERRLVRGCRVRRHDAAGHARARLDRVQPAGRDPRHAVERVVLGDRVHPREDEREGVEVVGRGARGSGEADHLADRALVDEQVRPVQRGRARGLGSLDLSPGERRVVVGEQVEVEVVGQAVPGPGVTPVDGVEEVAGEPLAGEAVLTVAEVAQIVGDGRVLADSTPQVRPVVRPGRDVADGGPTDRHGAGRRRD